MATDEERQSIATRTDSSERTSDESYITSQLRMVQLIVVQSSLGQKLLSFADRFLWTVEKCAEWSLPAEKRVGEDGKTVPKPEYVRPLPWYLFLLALLIMRAIRMMINIGAHMMGYSKITPNKIVNLMQSSRRSVHAVKTSGLKHRQEQESKGKRLSMHEARKALIRTIRLTLSTLSCLDASKPSLSPPPTRIHVNSAFVLDSTSPSSQTSNTVRSSPKSDVTPDSAFKETSESIQSSSESEESLSKSTETLQEMINRLAEENSSDDEDFNPDDEDTNDEDDSDDDNSEDDNISMVELISIIEEANELLDIKDTSDQADHIKQDFNQEVKQTSEEKAKHISEDRVEQSSQGATKQDSKDDLERTTPTEKRLSSEESRTKVDDRLTSSQSHDSLECYTPDRSSQEGDLTFYSPISSDSDTPKEHSASSAPTADKIIKTNQFINGEVRFVSEAMISEPKSTRAKTNNGAVVEKRSTNVSKIHRGKRTSHGNRKKK